METFTVKDLRENTGELMRAAEAGHLAVVTERGRPVFVAIPFDEQLIRLGVNRRLAIQLYKEEVVSIGLAAEIAGLSLEAFMELLGSGSIAVVNYDSGDVDNEVRDWN